jgi:hypothetical protein
MLEARSFSNKNLKLVEYFDKVMASSGNAEVLQLKAVMKLSQYNEGNVLFEKWCFWLTFGLRDSSRVRLQPFSLPQRQHL